MNSTLSSFSFSSATILGKSMDRLVVGSAVSGGMQRCESCILQVVGCVGPVESSQQLLPGLGPIVPRLGGLTGQ